MSFQAMAWAIEQKVDGPTSKLILLLLANFADEEGVCFPKQATLAEMADCSLRTVKYALERLRAAGLISDAHRHRADGTQCANRYQLDLPGRAPNMHPASARVQKKTGQSAEFALQEPVTEPVTLKKENPLRGKKKEVSRRGARLCATWQPSTEDETYALAKGLSRERIRTAAERFKNYWLAKSGENATKLDWSRTWQNWVLNEIERGAANGHAARLQRTDQYNQPIY